MLMYITRWCVCRGSPTAVHLRRVQVAQSVQTCQCPEAAVVVMGVVATSRRRKLLRWSNKLENRMIPAARLQVGLKPRMPLRYTTLPIGGGAALWLAARAVATRTIMAVRAFLPSNALYVCMATCHRTCDLRTRLLRAGNAASAARKRSHRHTGTYRHDHTIASQRSAHARASVYVQQMLRVWLPRRRLKSTKIRLLPPQRRQPAQT